MNQLFARQLGRLAFGAVLLGGFAWLACQQAVASFIESGFALLLPQLPAWEIIVVTWLAAIAAGAAARALAARLRSPRLLDAWSVKARFAASLIAPVAGIALLLPITLQLPFVVVLRDAWYFDLWTMGSVWITAPAHAVFAGLAVLRAHRLATGKPAVSPYTIYVATVLTSCAPVVFLAEGRVEFVNQMMGFVATSSLEVVPPLLVALTALPFVPMLHAMRRRIDRERAEIAEAQDMPHAIAVRAPRGA